MDSYEIYDALMEKATKLFKNDFDLLSKMDYSNSGDNTVYCDFIISTNPEEDEFTDEQFIEFKDFVNNHILVKDDYEIFGMQDVKDTGVFVTVELKEPSVDLGKVADDLENFAEELWDKYIIIRDKKTESKKRRNENNYTPFIVEDKDEEWYDIYLKENSDPVEYKNSLEEAYAYLKEKFGFEKEDIKVIDIEDYSRTFMIPVKITFEGTVQVKAKDGYEADDIVESDFYCSLGNCVSKNDAIVDWDISRFGETEIDT